jgi:hypothetical protein
VTEGRSRLWLLVPFLVAVAAGVWVGAELYRVLAGG